MFGRKLFAATFTAGITALGALAVLGATTHANAVPGAPALSSESSRSAVIEIKRRRQGRPLYVPIVPYLAYDYPYYYRRGFYPQHIGPGYIYYGSPYFRGKPYTSRCSHRYWRCVARYRGNLRLKRRFCRCR